MYVTIFKYCGLKWKIYFDFFSSLFVDSNASILYITSLSHSFPTLCWYYGRMNFSWYIQILQTITYELTGVNWSIVITKTPALQSMMKTHPNTLLSLL